MGGKLVLGALGTRAALDFHVNGRRARNIRASLGSKTVFYRKDRHHIVYPTRWAVSTDPQARPASGFPRDWPRPIKRNVQAVGDGHLRLLETLRSEIGATRRQRCDGGEQPGNRRRRQLLDDLELTDVTFAIVGQRSSAHRQVLVARREYFKALVTSVLGIQERRSSVAGGNIVLEGGSTDAFSVLPRCAGGKQQGALRVLRHLYTRELPVAKNNREGHAAVA